MAEAGFKPTIIDVPVGFFVETSEKNLLWLIFGVTGEQLYNWGLRQGAFLAFAVAWSTSYLQHWALSFDEMLGATMKLLGLDLGDEAAKLCCRVWTETTPDMVRPRPSPTTSPSAGAPPTRSARTSPSHPPRAWRPAPSWRCS